MNREFRLFASIAAGTCAWLLLACLADSASATLWMPGNYQAAYGSGGDWDPPNAPQFNDLGGGVHELELMGISGAVSLSRYQYKVLDDEGTGPAAWGDPEVPDNGGGSANSWFVTDNSGNATIRVDRNTYDDGLFPTTDRITASTDLTEFASFYATGNWMDEAGGGADWIPDDFAFEMVDQGNGLFSIDVVISTPGTYEYKATGGGWDFQWGTNGRLADSANLLFNVVAENQEVTFLLDVSKGAIGYNTDTFLPGDTDNDGVVEFEDDFYPIRDNWLSETFLRASGNLDNSGDSEGIVDIADFRQWKNAFNGPPELVAQAFASLGVPEPVSGTLCALAVVAFAARRRRV
ncbi:MAG: hypothetical protein KDA61_20445 [Planctomycetales bacterium]|nr:hypothetical protein [Planctomycetales bacterium]